MSRFSFALAKALEDRGVNQTWLTSAAELAPGQASRYLSADAEPGEAVLERICNALPEAKTTLIGTWVSDRIPSFGRDLVGVFPLETPQAGADAPPRPPDYAHLPGRARRLLDEFVTKAESKPELIDALEVLLGLTRRA